MWGDFSFTHFVFICVYFEHLFHSFVHLVIHSFIYLPATLWPSLIIIQSSQNFFSSIYAALNLRILPAKNEIHTVKIVYRERNVIIWCTLFNERYSLHKLAHHPKPNWVSEHKFIHKKLKFQKQTHLMWFAFYLSRFFRFSTGREIVAQKMEWK